MGTDYPFELGDDHPLENLAAVPRLSGAERGQIGGEAAAALLGL